MALFQIDLEARNTEKTTCGALKRKKIKLFEQLHTISLKGLHNNYDQNLIKNTDGRFEEGAKEKCEPDSHE